MVYYTSNTKSGCPNANRNRKSAGWKGRPFEKPEHISFAHMFLSFSGLLLTAVMTPLTYYGVKGTVVRYRAGKQREVNSGTS